MELYIHIPFCIRKCAYCDFLSGPADEQTQDRYMTALLREVALAGERHLLTNMECNGRKHGHEGGHSDYSEIVDTIFIGGGTPSVINAEWIVRLMEQVRASFPLAEDAEITMEANPGTLTADKLARYRQAGINRLSIGLQSTDDEELRCLGRIYTYEEFLENYRLAREAGFTNINIDLMSALPGQTVESYEQTLRRVIALEPEHISAYSLIIEEGTPFWERYRDETEVETADGGVRTGTGTDVLSEKFRLPTEEEDRQMYHLTKEILAQAGYERYEISNYARRGRECRHNVGYWTRVPYLGLGRGAASYYGGQRFSNTRDMQEYLTLLGAEMVVAGENRLERTVVAGEDSPERTVVGSEVAEGLDNLMAALRQDIETLSVQDSMEEFMFLGLRLTQGISAAEFQAAFGQKIEEVYGSVLERLTGQGLLERTAKGWRLTEWGLDVSNSVLAEFLF